MLVPTLVITIGILVGLLISWVVYDVISDTIDFFPVMCLILGALIQYMLTLGTQSYYVSWTWDGEDYFITLNRIW